MDDRTAVRGAIRDFLEATTLYKVCDAVNDGVSSVRKATDSGCDLILLYIKTPLQDSLVTALLLRSKLPSVKVVGVSTLSVDLEGQVSPETAFDAVVSEQDGLPKLVETLKAMMPLA